MVITVAFNESACSANMQNFVTETGLFGVFQEISRVEPDKREARHKHCSKCIDNVLAIERMLRNTIGTEIVECSETIESDYRVHLTDVDFQIILQKILLRVIQGAT